MPQLHRSSTRAILCSRWRLAHCHPARAAAERTTCWPSRVELVGILFILNPAHLEISLRGFLEIITATLLFATIWHALQAASVSRLGAHRDRGLSTSCIGGLEMLGGPVAWQNSGSCGCAMRAVWGSTSLSRHAVFHGFYAQVDAAFVPCRASVCAGHRLSAHGEDHGVHLCDGGVVRLSRQAHSGNGRWRSVVYHEHHQREPHGRHRDSLLAASLCVSVPVLREMRRERAVKT